jgi:hypothetical protein
MSCCEILATGNSITDPPEGVGVTALNDTKNLLVGGQLTLRMTLGCCTCVTVRAIGQDCRYNAPIECVGNTAGTEEI